MTENLLFRKSSYFIKQYQKEKSKKKKNLARGLCHNYGCVHKRNVTCFVRYGDGGTGGVGYGVARTGVTGTGEGISSQAICMLTSPRELYSEDAARKGCEGCPGCRNIEE